MKVYISGPISGLPDNNYPAFDACADELREQGHDPINPADRSRILAKRFEDNGLPPPEWIEYICEALLALAECEAITYLPGWHLSHGACIEHCAARRCNLEVLA